MAEADRGMSNVDADDLQRVVAGDTEHARVLVERLTEFIPDGHIVKTQCMNLLASWDAGDMPPQEVVRNVSAVVSEWITADQVKRAADRIRGDID